MNINEYMKNLVEEGGLRVGQKFKIKNDQYEIIQCLKNKCKVKFLSGKNKDEEIYLFNGQINTACIEK